MDNMYTTVQLACKMARRAHNKEKRPHVVFKEMGLFRIRPVEDILEINQKAIFGWTVPSWKHELHKDLTWRDVKTQFPMGDDCFVRKQFYENDCYFNPEHAGLTLYDKYTLAEIDYCLKNGQEL